MIDVILPELGEDVTEAVVSFWHYEEGDTIEEGEDLVEMLTEKATFNVPSPSAGVLSKIYAEEGQTVKIGEIIAAIDEKK
ncbi:MAG: biotin/lipoyl-containing protein [Candidatus Omnitrophota bacterium]